MNLLEKIENTSPSKLSIYMFLFIFLLFFSVMYYNNPDLFLLALTVGSLFGVMVGFLIYDTSKKIEYSNKFFEEYRKIEEEIQTIKTRKELLEFLNSDQYHNLFEMKYNSYRKLQELNTVLKTLRRVLQ